MDTSAPPSPDRAEHYSDVAYPHLAHAGHAVDPEHAQPYSQQAGVQGLVHYAAPPQHQQLPSEIHIQDHTPPHAADPTHRDVPSPDTQPQAQLDQLHAQQLHAHQLHAQEAQMATMSMEEQQRHLASLAEASMHASGHGHALAEAMQTPLAADMHLPELLASNGAAGEGQLYHLQHAEHPEELEDMNGHKRPTFKTSKHPCVSWNRSKQQWKAQLKLGKQTVPLGFYQTEEEAIQAAEAAKEQVEATGSLPPPDESTAPGPVEKGPVGASFSKVKGKWRAQIMRNNRNRHLGYFDTKEEALAVYEAARKDGIFPESRRQGVLDPRHMAPEGNILPDSGRVKSAYPGVTWNKQKAKWQTRICSGGKRRNLGYFASDKEAHEAYMRAKEQDSEARRMQGPSGGGVELPLPELPSHENDAMHEANTLLVDEPPPQPLYSSTTQPDGAQFHAASGHAGVAVDQPPYQLPIPNVQHYEAETQPAERSYIGSDGPQAAGRYGPPQDDQEQDQYMPSQDERHLQSAGMQYAGPRGMQMDGHYSAHVHQTLPASVRNDPSALEDTYLNPVAYGEAQQAYAAYADQRPAAIPARGYGAEHHQELQQPDAEQDYDGFAAGHMPEPLHEPLQDGQTELVHEEAPTG